MTEPGLARLLEERRAALEALPGVIGTAVGAGADGPAIHLYVSSEAEPGRVGEEAARLLPDAPIEVIGVDMPEGQSD